MAACVEIVTSRGTHLLYQAAKRLGDRLVAIPRRMLMDERSSRALMTETGHQLLEACASGAVWDGEPARAYGGTADVVAEARKRGIPVTIIWPEGASRDEAA